MNRRIVVSILNCLFWTMLLYMGWLLYSGISAQGVSGYPSAGQRSLYLLFPAAMVLLSAILIIFANKIQKRFFIAILLMQFILIPPFVLLSGGGI